MAPTEFAWSGPGGQRDGTGKGGCRASRRKIRALGCATVAVMSRAAVLVCLFAVACSPGRSSPILPRAAPPTSSATASELHAEEEPAEPLGEPVNVLWGGPSSVAVSSTAKGGRPSALVDGVAANAWEAAVGDTPGAAISVVVPSGTAITELMLTAGFDGTSPAGKDLFSSHSRARKIRITALPGTTFPTFEWTLDPTLRTPQHVPFSVPAHREEEGPLGFSVLVVETDGNQGGSPGRRGLLPLALSEFVVLGHLGTRWKAPEPPRVTVGALAPLPERPPGAFDGFVGHLARNVGLENPCTAYEEAVEPALQRASDDFETALSPIPEYSKGSLPEKPWCLSGPSTVAARGPDKSRKLAANAAPKTPPTTVALVDLELPNDTARVLRVDLPRGSAFLRGSAVCGDVIAEDKGTNLPCSDGDQTVNARITAASVSEEALTVDVTVTVPNKGDGSAKRPTKNAEIRVVTFYCPLDSSPLGCRRSERNHPRR